MAVRQAEEASIVDLVMRDDTMAESAPDEIDGTAGDAVNSTASVNSTATGTAVNSTAPASDVESATYQSLPWQALMPMQRATKNKRSPMHPALANTTVVLPTKHKPRDVKVQLQCAAPGYRLLDESTPDSSAAKCYALVEVIIAKKFVDLYHGADVDEAATAGEHLLVEVLERCVHRAQPMTPAMAQARRTPTPVTFHLLKWSGGDLAKITLEKEQSAGSSAMTASPKNIHGATLVEISFTAKLAGNLSKTTGANTGLSRKIKHVLKEERKAISFVSDRARTESIKMLDVSEQARGRAGVIFVTHNAGGTRYVLTNANRVNTTIALACGGIGGATAALTTGVAIDSTMKVVQQPKLTDNVKFDRMWTTIGAIRSPNTTERAPTLDAFEFCHISGKETDYEPMIAVIETEIANVRQTNRAGFWVFVMDQDVALGNGVSAAVNNRMRFLKSKDSASSRTSLEEELAVRMTHFATAAVNALKELIEFYVPVSLQAPESPLVSATGSDDGQPAPTTKSREVIRGNERLPRVNLRERVRANDRVTIEDVAELSVDATTGFVVLKPKNAILTALLAASTAAAEGSDEQERLRVLVEKYIGPCPIANTGDILVDLTLIANCEVHKERTVTSRVKYGKLCKGLSVSRRRWARFVAKQFSMTTSSSAVCFTFVFVIKIFS